MNLNINKTMVLSILLLSAIFAITTVSTASLATHSFRSDPAVHSSNEISQTLTYTGGSVKGISVPCGGDPISGGGHP